MSSKRPPAGTLTVLLRNSADYRRRNFSVQYTNAACREWSSPPTPRDELAAARAEERAIAARHRGEGGHAAGHGNRESQLRLLAAEELQTVPSESDAGVNLPIRPSKRFDATTKANYAAVWGAFQHESPDAAGRDGGAS